MSNQSQTTQIYVALLDEGVDVWRPVTAARLQDDVYRISSGEKPDVEEVWQFQPGDLVRCELMTFSGGSQHMTAVELAGDVI